jgi:hypothetical protein
MGITGTICINIIFCILYGGCQCSAVFSDRKEARAITIWWTSYKPSKGDAIFLLIVHDNFKSILLVLQNLFKSVYFKYAMHLVFWNGYRISIFHYGIMNYVSKGKGKVFPLQAWAGPWGSGRLRLRIFSTFGTMKVVRSSPLRTGRLYLQEFAGTHF